MRDRYHDRPAPEVTPPSGVRYIVMFEVLFSIVGFVTGFILGGPELGGVCLFLGSLLGMGFGLLSQRA